MIGFQLVLKKLRVIQFQCCGNIQRLWGCCKKSKNAAGDRKSDGTHILLFCVTLLNTLSEEKKESGEPYRFGKILRAHYIFSLFYPGVRVRLLAFIVAFAALLLPQQGQCNTTLCQLTVNVRIVRFNVQALLYLSGKSIRFGSALVMSSSTGHCMACLSISAKTSRTVCREQ